VPFDGLLYLSDDLRFFTGDIAAFRDACVELKEEGRVVGCVVAKTAPRDGVMVLSIRREYVSLHISRSDLDWQ
jgi:hypothetical protein